jgi:predicted 2-oxoglutarate/Fe(II)-dependent dioxygenase YbiX
MAPMRTDARRFDSEPGAARNIVAPAMPSAAAFKQLGFFVQPHFLDEATCAELIASISAASGDRGGIVTADGAEVVDEARRTVSRALLDKPLRTPIKQRFRAIMPELAAHFGVQLVDCESPNFLVYDPGAFYEWHRDSNPESGAEYIRRRAVSVVVLLNGTGEGSSALPIYAGGTLRFIGVLEGPLWEKCPLPFDTEPGALIAFRSSIMHEVMPVTMGRRFSIVTWFASE